MTTLRQAAEPFAWMFEDDYERMKKSETFCEVYSVKVGNPERGETEIELYTAPPQRQWVGLTEFEITNCFGLVEWFDPQNDVVEFSNGEILEIAKAIETNLRKKNHDRA